MSGIMSKSVDNRAAVALLAAMAVAFTAAYWIVGSIAGSLTGFLAASVAFWSVALVGLPLLARYAPAKVKA